MQKIYSVRTNKSCDFYELRQQQKQLKTIGMNENDLIFTMRDIYINSNPDPLTKLSSSSRSTEFNEILPWNVSQIFAKAVLISARTAISCTMKIGIPFCVWKKADGNWDNNMIFLRIFQWKGSYCRANTWIRRKKINLKEEEGLWEPVRGPSRKVNHLSEVVWEWTHTVMDENGGIQKPLPRFAHNILQFSRFPAFL